MTIIMCRGKKVWTGTAKSAAEVAGQLVQVGKLNCSIKTHFHIFWAYFLPLNKLYSYSLTWLDWYYPCLLRSWECAFIFTSSKCSHHTDFEDNLTSTDVQFCKNSSLFTKKKKQQKKISSDCQNTCCKGFNRQPSEVASEDGRRFPELPKLGLKGQKLTTEELTSTDSLQMIQIIAKTPMRSDTLLPDKRDFHLVNTEAGDTADGCWSFKKKKKNDG